MKYPLGSLVSCKQMYVDLAFIIRYDYEYDDNHNGMYIVFDLKNQFERLLYEHEIEPL